jgi:ATP-dependent DNA helicase DinG
MTAGPSNPRLHPPRIVLPQTASIVAGAGRAAMLTADGELMVQTARQVARQVGEGGPPLVVHAPSLWRRLDLRPMAAFDLLELFAFVLPARSASPTPRGLAIALDLPPPAAGLEAAAAALPALAEALLGRLAGSAALPNAPEVSALAATMAAGGWLWAPFVLAALGSPEVEASAEALRVWKRLPEWEDAAPAPPPSSLPVAESEARARLASLLGASAEQRPGQADYAAAVTAAFAPAERRGDPHLVLAEAGTGTGKTLGYIAPASLWAERNHGPVWLSTYTRHLQRQIEGELHRLFPDPAERRRRSVLRKGRENYLCLLNYEDAVAASGLNAAPRVLLGLVARWALATSDGDLQGGDLPGWLGELFGPGTVSSLADRRGECIHGGCPHYRRCFVEHTVRRARSAELVVANHALVMAQAAWGGIDDASVPTRYVFDEGHHVFDAADSAFAAELSGVETSVLRHWLLGPEGGRSRYRGLRRRMEDLLAVHPALEPPLDALLLAAKALPASGWSARLADEEEAAGAAEAFLALCRRQVLARAAARPPRAGGGMIETETDLHPALAELPQAAAEFARALAGMGAPLRLLLARLGAWAEEEAETLESGTRLRIEALTRSLQHRALDRIGAWIAMLEEVAEAPPAPGSLNRYVHLVFLDRREAGDRDAGMRRHWLDPTVPFTASIAAAAQGVLITSATLRDTGPDPAAAWEAAEARVGAPHLPSPALRATVSSPFDYEAQTRVFVVNDLVGSDIGQLASAYRVLFEAAGGGGLGLFTAISRLVAVHARIAPALEAQGIALLAQHVDAMDNATLVDVFRTELDSCLLGTDAMRDGVDVPGRALRLVVFERVPWPRPDILHRERRVHLSGGDPTGYDDRIARLRLRQAFGRLIRSATDRGVFVLLDRRTPTRLLSAFPPEVTVERVGLADCAAQVKGFLGPQ